MKSLVQLVAALYIDSDTATSVICNSLSTGQRHRSFEGEIYKVLTQRYFTYRNWILGALACTASIRDFPLLKNGDAIGTSQCELFSHCFRLCREVAPCIARTSMNAFAMTAQVSSSKKQVFSGQR